VIAGTGGHRDDGGIVARVKIWASGAVLLLVAGPAWLALARPAGASGCVVGSDVAAVTANIEVLDVNLHEASARVRARMPFCQPMQIDLSSYRVPATWDGTGWDATAVPQVGYRTVTGVLSLPGVAVTLVVGVPSCGNVQTDLYVGPTLDTVTAAGHGTALLDSALWAGPACATPTPTPPPPAPAPTSPPPVPLSPTAPAPSATLTHHPTAQVVAHRYDPRHWHRPDRSGWSSRLPAPSFCSRSAEHSC
jgi:hypothetical protein